MNKLAESRKVHLRAEGSIGTVPIDFIIGIIGNFGKKIISVPIIFIIAGYTLAIEEDNNGLKVISVMELRDLQKNRDKDLILIDVDTANKFKEEHIDGAINIPLEDMEDRKKEIPADKLIVTYCHCGEVASVAIKAAVKLLEMDFNNVVYLGVPSSAYRIYKSMGYPIAVDLTKYIEVEKIRNINGYLFSPEEQKNIIRQASENRNKLSSVSAGTVKNYTERESGGFKIIDLRSNAEYRKAHIPGAKNIPLEDIEKNMSKEEAVFLKELPRDIVMFLYSHDDEKAADKIRQMGFNSVHIIENGFSGWIKNGYKVETAE